MKGIAIFLFAACLLVPSLARAAEYGVYVTPKIGGAIQNYDGLMDIGIAGLPNMDLGSIDASKGSFGGGIALGYDFNTRFAVPVRAELEYTAWTSVDDSKHFEYEGGALSAKGEVGIQSLFANVYYDIHNKTQFTPYVGAGLGMGLVKTKGKIGLESDGGSDSIDFGSKTKANLAWNVGLGCSYAFTDTISADLGYRYASFGSGKTGSIGNEDGSVHLESKHNEMHQLMLGARLTF